MKTGIFSFLILFFSAETFAQEKSIPEIDNLLSKSEKLANLNVDSALNYAFKAAELSEKKNDSSCIAKSYVAIGNLYDNMDEADNAVTYYQKSFNASKNLQA